MILPAVEITTKKKFCLKLTPKLLRELLAPECFIPTDATISVLVPGGGDWSNTDLDITEDRPVTITWTYTE